MYARESYDTFVFCYVCKGIHSGIPFFSDASDEGINEKKRLCEGVPKLAALTGLFPRKLFVRRRSLDAGACYTS